MYVYMDIYICMYVYIHLEDTYRYIHIDIYIHTYIDINIDIYKHTYIDINIDIDISVWKTQRYECFERRGA